MVLKKIFELQFAILLVFSQISLFCVNGVNVSTFDDGLEEVILEFPSAGFNNSIYFSLPENGTVVDAKMKLTGLPFVLNQTIYPQISGIFDNTTIEGNSLVLGNKQNWWSNWSYRIMVELNAKEKQREDIIAELDLNFTKILNENGIEGNVDIDSIRVVEYDSSLQPIVFDNSIENEEKYLVPHKFSKDIYFNETRNVNGTLLWLARGITYTDEKRTYMLYFDTIDRKESKYLLNLYNDIVFSNHYSGASYDLDSYAYLNPFIDNVLDYSLPTKGAKDVKIADLNRDGYFDIVFANHYTTNPSSSWEINSYIYHGGKTIDKNVDVLLPTKGAEGVDIGDINGDGWLDVVFANYRNNGGATAITSVLYYNSPEGIDTFPDVNFSTNGAIDVTVGHLNQDNYLDIAFANYAGNTVTIYYGSAGGMAPNPTPDLTISVTTPYGLKIYDVSKDGYNDLLVVRTTSPSYIYNGTSTGMEATADVSLPTADSRGVDAADLNNDGYVDVIFANYASPAYIYYGPFGSTKTAIDVQLPTDDRTVDVSIGELNNDVYMDAVLPNYMRGSNIYATDSFVYYGSSNWNAVIDIRLPTIGAYASAIADIDRYYMRLDTKPPEITIIKIEGKYMKNGTFISNPINEDEIYCVEAYWENILPKGTNITFSVSNDLSTWQIIEKNELYRFPSVCGTLAYKIDLATNSDFYSPKVSKIKLKYERGAYPSNISLDICDNGKIDWVYTEKLKTTVLTTNFATELSNYIISNPRSGIPINITVKSEGKLKLSPLIIVDIPPTLIKQIPSNITLLEDTLNHYLIDLYEYFVDDLDVKENLIFEVAYTNSTVVGISIYNYRYLSVDALNGKENDNWYGKLEIVISCADKRRQVTYSNNFSIEVTPVNDPPFIKSSPVVSAIENKFYNYNVTATDVDNDKLFYSLELMPEGMTIDENGAISWLPRQEQIGDNDVIVNVSDGELYVKQEFTIQVKSASSCMEFITVPQTEACVKSSYIYNAIAVDKVNPKNKIYYSLDLAPVGMSIDKDGKLTWTPSPENVGEFEVWVNATNNILFIIQKFKINVSYPLPTSTIIFPTNGMSINGTIRISGSASALVGKIQYVQIRIDDGAWIDAFGFDSWYFDFDTRNFEDGSHIIYARAYDGKKYSNESSVSVFIKNKKKVEEKAFSIAEIFLPLIVICISIGIISGYAIGKKKYRVRDKWKAAIDAITYSQQTITESKFKGMVVDEAETLLNQAKEYLSTGEYELAKQKAIESIGMIRASEKI